METHVAALLQAYEVPNRVALALAALWQRLLGRSSMPEDDLHARG